MADEELDAGLVERAGRAAWQESADGELTDETWNDWRYRRLRAAYCNEARAALLSLPIPAAALNALARGEAVVRPKLVLRPLAEWHEDFGPVLWWILPLQEPPHVGDPNDDDWPGYHTHWTPIECPEQPLPAPPGGDHDGSR